MIVPPACHATRSESPMNMPTEPIQPALLPTFDTIVTLCAGSANVPIPLANESFATW